jgi:dTDP-4-dehydrorhamnose reductase
MRHGKQQLDASMRVTVVGVHGQVARALARRASGRFNVVRLGRPTFDLERVRDATSQIAETRPDVIVNAAAFTNVEGAEKSQETAFRVNEAGAGIVAQAAATLGVPLIHLSTEYVFDGNKPTPYSEEDPTAPLSVYGRSKLAGERAVASATDDYVILRTSWVYSTFGGFFAKILERAATSSEIPVVADRFGAPTSAFELARGIEQVARNLVQSPSARAGRGIFHMTCAGQTSWAGFAIEILRGRNSHVRPIRSDALVELARRPANSLLCNDRLLEVHGVALAHWQDALSDVLEQLDKPIQQLAS